MDAFNKCVIECTILRAAEGSQTNDHRRLEKQTLTVTYFS